MGYMRHHAIIVTSWSVEGVDEARSMALDYGLTVTETCPSPVNGYVSFLVVPDGSKEGWADSDTGDERRAQMITWLHKQEYDDGSNRFEWAEIVYGDEEGELSIRGSSR